MIRLPEYTKPIAEYKPEAQLILGKPCYVQEKFDGSQFTFAHLEGNFYARSRGQQIDVDNPNELFRPAIEGARALIASGALPKELIYRAEAFKGPKHNSLKYDRAPHNNFVLFDVQNPATGDYWDPNGFMSLGPGVEYGAALAYNLVFTLRSELVEWAAEHSQRQSQLGGAVEGFVFKEIQRRTGDRAIVKVVRDEFKELHKSNEEYNRVGSKSGLDKVLARLAGPARYMKAVSHVRERGELKNAMQDMPALMKEINLDLDADNADIQALLWEVFGKEIKRYLGGGLALWYKDQLRNL